MGNYRPISLLSTLSKVFEMVVFEQIYEYLNYYLIYFIRTNMVSE